MKRLSFALALLAAPMLAPMPAMADADGVIMDIVTDHILPRFEALASSTQALSDTAAAQCDPASEPLREAYGAAFDAWISASHLRFGPTEVDERAFALAFWPDSRGATPRTLAALLAEQDPIAASIDDFAQVSIAARGFYAMEFLLYDEALMAAGAPSYHCQLVQTISADMAQTAQSILDGWTDGYADTLQNPTPTGVYRSDEEALQEMLKALSTGLQFTSDTRLGRPLGTFDNPRPTRAEARRSGRSARHVMLSLLSLQDLAARLAGDDTALADDLNTAFARALTRLDALDDPIFASVSAPQTRLKVEVIQQSVDTIRAILNEDLGPTLGVAAGFNALDGD